MESARVSRTPTNVSPVTARQSAVTPPSRTTASPGLTQNLPPAIRLSPAPSGGDPLPASVLERLSNSLNADLSAVRVHTGPDAAAMARAQGARAVTVGNHIFLGAGEQPTDLAVMAHEVAHAVQQQGAPAVKKFTARGGDVYEREAQRAASAVISNENFAVQERTSGPRAQRLGISDALDYFADKANFIPGFRMFTIVLGVNPINMSSVERSPANIMRAVVEFIPGGAFVTQALDNHGVFDKVGNWVAQQIKSLGMVGSSFKQAITDFLNSLGWRDIFRLGDVWNRAKRIFTAPIDRLINFAKGLITGIIRFIKDAILRPLAKLAEGTRGYDLLKAVLGQDPVTGDPVPRTAQTLIGGFMKLIGQEEIWNNIQKANAIPRAWAWFQGALAGLLGFVRQIPALFVRAFTSLELMDIVLVPRAFAKIAAVFGSFIAQFLSWAGNTIWNLLQIIFEVVAPGAMPYLKKAAGAFRTILKNPIGFVGNLVKAGKQGFQQFAKNIGKHLKKSLIEWLTGSLSGAGVYIPQAFELREIIKFVLSVLGLTWANVRAKMVKAIGETAVKVLETAFDIVVVLVKEGPAAAWEKIKEQLSNLKEMVLSEIMSFVIQKVVESAIVKLISFLNPAGAFIQAIIATYNTIMFFVERLKTIIQVVMAFIDSIAAIAAGVIGAAANKVESVLGGLLTLAISFLARLVGLGKVSDAVKKLIDKIRAPIDRALDKVVDWIKATAQKILAKFTGKDKKDARSEQEKKADVHKAILEVSQLMKPPDASAKTIKAKLSAIKSKYKLTSLTLLQDDKTKYHAKAVINPEESGGTEDLGIDDGTIPEPIWEQAVTQLAEGRKGKDETRLSPSSAQLNRTVLMDYIARAPASVTLKARAQATMASKIAAALAATDGDKIYRLLVEATRAVTTLYPAGAISLQVHHVEQVRDNPTTFYKTRAQRTRPKINTRIKKLPPKEQAKVVGRPEVIKLWVEQILDQETTEKPQKLMTIDLIVLTQEAHLGKTGVHQQP